MKSWKPWLFVLPLIAAGALAGEACRRLTELYPSLTSDPTPISGMLTWLIAALIGMALAGGLASALLGAGAVRWIACALAAVAMLLTWGPGLLSGLGALVFFVATVWSVSAIRRELDGRIRFPRPGWGRLPPAS